MNAEQAAAIVHLRTAQIQSEPAAPRNPNGHDVRLGGARQLADPMSGRPRTCSSFNRYVSTMERSASLKSVRS